MSRKKPNPTRRPDREQKKPQSVFQEAWENMNADFERLLPESLRRRQGKKKVVLWLLVVELLVLGVVGKLVYDWIAGP